MDLISYGVLPEDYTHLACDPNKLLRTRRKVMDKAKSLDQEKPDKGDKISAIYFDVRRDNTVSMIPDDRGHLHRRILKENHINVTVEPEGKYLHHFTPSEPVHPEKPAQKEAQGLFELLDQQSAKESCLVLGVDSNNSNTGF